MSLSALQIYYDPGHWIQCLPAHKCVHNLHSLGSIPARCYLTLKNCLINNDGRILPRTHLTPGRRVASAG